MNNTPAEESLSATPEPESFEITKWLQGLHHLERSCTVYSRVDLLAVIDTIYGRVKLAKLRGENTEQLRAEAIEAAREIEESALVFTIQAWTDTRYKLAKDELLAQGISEEETNYHLIAAQIVSPPGITADILKRIEEASPQQAGLIAQTALKANQEVVNPTIPF